MDNKRPLNTDNRESISDNEGREFAESRDVQSNPPSTTMHSQELNKKSWIWPVLFLLALALAMAAGLMWSAENQRNSELEQKNAQLSESRAASAESDNSPQATNNLDDSTNRRLITSELAAELRQTGAQHVCQAETCAGMEFEVEQVLLSSGDEEASFARVEAEREAGDNTDLFLKRDSADTDWRVVHEAEDDNVVPTAVRDAGFPEEFFRQ